MAASLEHLRFASPVRRVSLRKCAVTLLIAGLVVACARPDLRDPSQRMRAEEVVALIREGRLTSPGEDFMELVRLPPTFTGLSATDQVAVSQPEVAGSLFVTFFVEAKSLRPDEDRTFVYSESGEFGVLVAAAWHIERLDDHWFYVEYLGGPSPSS